jgi:hypothetical protein
MEKRSSRLVLPAVAAVVSAGLTVGLASTFRLAGDRVAARVDAVGVAHASDHQDGDFSGRIADVDLTDHFAFREDTATSDAADVGNLILAQTSNPSIDFGAGDAPFNPKALYEIHVTRVTKANRTATPTGLDDVVFQFRFSGEVAPQTVTLTVIEQGTTIYSGSSGPGGTFQTTPIADAATPRVNQVTTSRGTLAFFAGLRRDPTTWDRARFLQVRDYAIARWIGGDAAATLSNTNGGNTSPVNAGNTPNFFRPAGVAVNQFDSRNVNAIVVRVPITFLQRNANDTVFDSWSTTSLATETLKGLDDAR